MAEAKHSTWGASKFESIMLCPGKHALEAGKPNSTSKYAAEGTAAHQVLTWALQQTKPAKDFIGANIEADGFIFVVDADMAGHVQTTIDYVYDLAGEDGVVFADIRVNYSSYLDVETDDAWGTADVIIARGNEIVVVDFKYGMGVEVSAGYDVFVTSEGVEVHTPVAHKPNPQMALYALGALQAYNGLVADFDVVRLAISQPRIKAAPSEYDMSVEALEVWGNNTAKAAVVACLHAETLTEHPQFNETFLRPGEKQCKFCKAKATCPQLRDYVSGAMLDIGFTPATPDEFSNANVVPVVEAVETVDNATEWLAVSLDKCDMIEDWCRAVRAEVERRMLAGDTVPGYKLVQGKQGNRAWTDMKAAEALLKSMRLKEAELYDFSVKSPTQIAKLGPVFDKDGNIKPQKEGTPLPVIGKRQWPKVEALITRAPAKPHVAPVSDSRPALVVTPVVDDFIDATPLDDLA